MNKKSAIFGAVVFAIIFASLLVVIIPAHAITADGPRPIPGYLFPHPSVPPHLPIPALSAVSHEALR